MHVIISPPPPLLPLPLMLDNQEDKKKTAWYPHQDQSMIKTLLNVAGEAKQANGGWKSVEDMCAYVKWLHSKSGFGWDDEKNMITASEQSWKELKTVKIKEEFFFIVQHYDSPQRHEHAIKLLKEDGELVVNSADTRDDVVMCFEQNSRSIASFLVLPSKERHVQYAHKLTTHTF
ncbi:hypothetical protein E1B28_010800 [Marasmius oreades]|uniref:Myb/SANT-like domain-containing protein n=1 Tax=Marasmius oreades TaxID=181124 RepID=A0A9P7RTT7_9AGAR|nr:uncharacterized protein E1B28_010800 [Marasmius oreades]KAG7089091.1 hypothetical protein E1B28_010800 [Marasmius oreades]